MSTAISVSGLVKTFGTTVALDGLDLEVRTGEVHGFLGPNGSGKSTTIRVLLGLLRADRGQVLLLGGDPWREAATLHRRLAYVPGEVALWPNLTGGEVIDLLARLRGGIDPKRRASLLERFDLDPTKKTRSYSKGNRQKVALVAALASDVELLLLDEPTSGLDPIMEATFRDCIGEVRARGRTVLLSSHILAEAEALSDRVSIIRAGRVVQSGTLQELRHLTRTTVIVKTERPSDRIQDVPGVAARGPRGRPRLLRRRHRPPRRRHGLPRAVEDHVAGQPSADPGGALPAPVRRHEAGARGRGGGGEGAGGGSRLMTAFTGVGPLIRFVLRRDRIYLPVWILALIGLTYLSAAAVRRTYDTPVEIASYAVNVGGSPASVAMGGPPVALYEIGGILIYETGLTALLGVALMAIFTVVRHTRKEEDAGRVELLGSTVVSPHAVITAAVLVAAGASLLVGAGVTLSFLAENQPSASRCCSERRSPRSAWCSRGLLRAPHS